MIDGFVNHRKNRLILYKTDILEKLFYTSFILANFFMKQDDQCIHKKM